eukprot:GFUD01036612.1.p2 GENE.GFUD01036612.1~~GFUD01036612.1.p2  ORF type:complete len:125 (+),score=11.10 GFUD01036612.1:309-683(+)
MDTETMKRVGLTGKWVKGDGTAPSSVGVHAGPDKTLLGKCLQAALGSAVGGPLALKLRAAYAEILVTLTGLAELIMLARFEVVLRWAPAFHLDQMDALEAAMEPPLNVQIVILLVSEFYLASTI